jgi:hypothetical protein
MRIVFTATVSKFPLSTKWLKEHPLSTIMVERATAPIRDPDRSWLKEF